MNFDSINPALYLNLIFFSMLGFGALFGMLRGFKRSLISFIFSAAFYLVFFMTLDLVIPFLWSLEISQLGTWIGMVLSGFPNTITTIEGVTHWAIENFAGAMIPLDMTNPELLLFVTSLGHFVLKIIWLLLYFTIGYLLFGLVRIIISAIFIKNNKTERKYGSKNPLMGAVMGTLQASIAVFVMLIMLGGLMNISENLITLIPEDAFETEDVQFEMNRPGLYQASQPIAILSSPLPFPIPGMDGMDPQSIIKFMGDFVNAYNENIVVQTIASVTITDPSNQEDQMALNVFLFDDVLSIKYKDQPIAFRKELNIIGDVARIAMESKYLAVFKISVDKV